MNDPCPHCGVAVQSRRRLRLPNFSRRFKFATAALVLVYCGLWGATQFIGTTHVKQSVVAQGSTIGAYTYSPMPFVVCVDETYFQPLSQRMQRADMRYGWAFGNVVELGASYISFPDDPHFAAF